MDLHVKLRLDDVDTKDTTKLEEAVRSAVCTALPKLPIQNMADYYQHYCTNQEHSMLIKSAEGEVLGCIDIEVN